MRSETWPARLVFALGALVMIATSPPPTWHTTEQLEAELHSEGQGDDKILRVHVRLTDGVAEDAGHFQVRVFGAVDRPASDLTIAWLDGAAIMVAEPFSTGDDFLTVSASHDSWHGSHGCADGDPCEVVFEGRIATTSSEAYTMQLTIEVVISGADEKKQPRGAIETDVEVLDAP